MHRAKGMSCVDYIGLGRRVKSARREKNLTQEHLADAVGISLSFLGHIERGSRKASLETLVKIANALSVSLDGLLCDSLKSDEKQTPAMRDAVGKKAEELEILNELSNYVNGMKDPWND